MLYWELNPDLTFTKRELHPQARLSSNTEFAFGNWLGLQVCVIRPASHVFNLREPCDEAMKVMGTKVSHFPESLALSLAAHAILGK